MSVWQWLVSTGVVAVVAERAWDWFRRTRIAQKDEIVKYARVAYAEAGRVVRDTQDKVLMHAQFARVIDAGLGAAGLSLGTAQRILVDEAFEQLWKVWTSDADNALAELTKAGEQAELFAGGLLARAMGVKKE